MPQYKDNGAHKMPHELDVGHLPAIHETSVETTKKTLVYYKSGLAMNNNMNI